MHTIFAAAIRPAVLLLLLTASALAQIGLVNGGTVSGAITTSGGQDSYTFAMQAGQYCVLRVVDDNGTQFYPVLEVLAPNGTQVDIDGDSDVAWVEFAAAASGTYQALVRDGNGTPVTGSYTIHFVRAPGANEGGALPSGDSVSGTITRGDLDSYTFSMVAGQSYALRFADVSLTSVYARMLLVAPTGALLAQDGDANVAALTGAAPITGTYTVVVMDGNGSPSSVGSYELHFVRAPGANEGGALVSGGSVTGALTVGDLDTFTFAMIAGENYQLRVVDSNFTGLYISARIYDPSGNLLVTDGDSNVASFASDVPVSGVYTLMVYDGNGSPASTGAYRIHFVRVPGATSGGELTSGTVANGTIDAGELESFTFAIQAGENYLLRATDVNFGNLYMSMVLYDSRGRFVAQDGDSNVASLSGVAGFTGDYTVVLFDGNGSPSNTGDFALYFNRVPGATSSGVLPNGGVVNGTLAAGEVESFTFPVEAGDSYFVRFIDVNAGNLYPTIALYDARGTFVAQDGSSTVSQLYGVAGFTGNYTVVIFDGNGSPFNVGDFEMRLAVMPGANEHGYLLDGVPATQTIGLGDVDSYTFVALAGDTVTVTMTDVQATALYPSFHVYAPGGQLLRQRGSSTVATDTFQAPFDGTYTIVAFDGNGGFASTGSYTIVVTGSGRLGNSGCDREGAAQLSGAISAATGFSIGAPEFARTCSTPGLIALGTGLPATVLLPDGVTCGVCGLGLANVFGIVPSPVVFPPLSPSAVGLTFVVQPLCLSGSCIALGAATELVVTP